MKSSTQLIGVFFPLLFLIAPPAFSTHSSHLSTSAALEKAQVRQVAQMIDHHHPNWVDAATKQSYREITAIKEQIEGMPPAKPTWISPLHH
jgi:hypothetical protein